MGPESSPPSPLPSPRSRTGWCDVDQYPRKRHNWGDQNDTSPAEIVAMDALASSGLTGEGAGEWRQLKAAEAKVEMPVVAVDATSQSTGRLASA